MGGGDKLPDRLVYAFCSAGPVTVPLHSDTVQLKGQSHGHPTCGHWPHPKGWKRRTSSVHVPVTLLCSDELRRNMLLLGFAHTARWDAAQGQSVPYLHVPSTNRSIAGYFPYQSFLPWRAVTIFCLCIRSSQRSTVHYSALPGYAGERGGGYISMPQKTSAVTWLVLVSAMVTHSRNVTCLFHIPNGQVCSFVVRKNFKIRLNIFCIKTPGQFIPSRFL